MYERYSSRMLFSKVLVLREKIRFVGEGEGEGFGPGFGPGAGGGGSGPPPFTPAVAVESLIGYPTSLSSQQAVCCEEGEGTWNTQAAQDVCA